MIAFNDNAFLNEVMPALPGIDLPIVVTAIRNAAIEFLNRSNAWHVALDPINVTPGVSTYFMAQPAAWTDPATNGIVISATLTSLGSFGPVLVQTTFGSPVITLPSLPLANNYYLGQPVQCDGFANIPVIIAIDGSLGQLTLSENASVTLTAATLTDMTDDGFDSGMNGPNAQPLLPKTSDWLDRWAPTWRTSPEGGTHYYTQLDNDNIILAAVPSQAAVLNLQVSMKPARTATGIPDVVFQSYLEDIAAGAKARLMMIPGKPWSSPQEAAYYGSLFEQAIAGATVDAALGFTRAPIRTTGSF